MARLESRIIDFRNIPTTEEASVASIFYELIGANKIKDLEPIISLYKNYMQIGKKYTLHFNSNLYIIYSK